ncbi:MAG: MFS transporter [Dehalococcoidia bacterium]|nr:MFS transporter [Dehalococcoidia bacterium]MDD5648292.1 MFS transporter [Dehalococcoidia bacterium]
MIECPMLPGGGHYQTGGWKAHWILIVCLLLYTLSYMDRVALTVVLQPMKLEMGWSDTQLGALQTAYMLSYGALAIPAAYLIDRWSRKKSIGVLAIMLNTFSGLTGLAWNFFSVIIPRIICGAGATGVVTGSIAMITAAYPKIRHGRAMGIFNMGIPLGIALGAIVGGVMAHNFGWRSPFLLLGGIGLLLSLAAFFLKDYKTINEGITVSLQGLWKSVIDLLRIPTLRWYYLGYAMMLVTSLAQINWMPTYLIRQFNIGTDTAGYLTCIISLVAIIGAPLGGVLSDFWYKRNRQGRLWLPALSSAVSALIMAASFLAFSINFALGLALILIFGIVNMTAIPALSVISQDVVPVAYKGLSYGVASLCMYALGGAWAPLLVGSISDALGGGANGLMWAVVIACSGGLLAGICFTIGARHYVADEDRVKGSLLRSDK